LCLCARDSILSKISCWAWVSAIRTDSAFRRQYGVYRTCRAWAFCRQV